SDASASMNGGRLLFRWRDALLSERGPASAIRRHVLLVLSMDADMDGRNCFPSTRRLAERTGGRFFTARDAGAVGSVYGEINKLERIELEEPDFRVKERFLPFLAAAAGLLLVGRFLSMAVLP
ncbi:MAG: hypothetical protein O7E54_05210, partial [Planctomycetota bacterium]|nr:hypothetical protein [Planctomycetota bacterium]